MTNKWCLARGLAHSKQLHLTCTFFKPQFPHLIILTHWVVVRIRDFIKSRKVCVYNTKAIGVVFRNYWLILNIGWIFLPGAAFSFS